MGDRPLTERPPRTREKRGARQAVRGPVVLAAATGPGPHGPGCVRREPSLAPSPSPRGAAVPRLGVLPVAVFTAAAAPGQRPVARLLPCSVGFFSAEMGTPRRYRGALVRCRPGLRGSRKPGRGSRSSEGSGALGARRTRIIGCRRQSRAPPQVSRPLAVIAFPAHRGLSPGCCARDRVYSSPVLPVGAARSAGRSARGGSGEAGSRLAAPATCPPGRPGQPQMHPADGGEAHPPFSRPLGAGADLE